MSFIEFKKIQKQYRTGLICQTALSEVSFNIEKGEFTLIVGPSGCGKSTTLNLLGGMDKPDGGSITVDRKVITEYTRSQLTAYRRYEIGFVFQFYNLISNLTVKENIEIAARIVKSKIPAEEVLEWVGLVKKKNNFPNELSGGEQQRVSIARALCKRPKILLCDEPTGALDSRNSQHIFQILHQLSRENDQTIVIVTHNSEIEQSADKIIRLKDGKISQVKTVDNPIPIDEVNF